MSNSAGKNFESSKYANLLRDECFTSIPKRRRKEIFLLIDFLFIFTLLAVYLWINALVYDYWFYIMIGIILIIVIAGYLMDRRYQPNWKYYFLEILKELKEIDTIELSNFINEGQPFFGANLANCEKFMKIAEELIENNIVDLVIRGRYVYLKGFEPPLEEKAGEENESNDS